MSDADRQRWDGRYGERTYEARSHPTPLLKDWLPRLPTGRALDVACGGGRNAIFLAGHGFEVDACDISTMALERAQDAAQNAGVKVSWIPNDLDETALPGSDYALIVVARYLNRGLFPALLEALRPGGYLVYETHMLSAREDVGGPGSSRFRLRPQELLRLGLGLRVVHYFEGIVTDPHGPTMALAQLIGCRGEANF